MFSRNKAGSPSIQSRKHKLIYNRINFAPPPSPWLCWVFRGKISITAALFDCNSVHVTSLLQGRDWFCVCFGCFCLPQSPYIATSTIDECLLAVLWKTGNTHTGFFGRHKCCLSYLPCMSLKQRSGSMQKKSSLGCYRVCYACICLLDSTSRYNRWNGIQKKTKTTKFNYTFTYSHMRCVFQFFLCSLDI